MAIKPTPKPKKTESFKAQETMKQMPKKTTKATIIAGPKPSKLSAGAKNTSTPKPKANTLTGPAAIKAIEKRTSPKGVKEYEKGASKALDKKYPGLYKKSK